VAFRKVFKEVDNMAVEGKKGSSMKFLVGEEQDWLSEREFIKVTFEWHVGLFELGFWGHELLGRLSWRLFSVVSWENIKVVFVKRLAQSPRSELQYTVAGRI
jgi:hypothetical protein